MIKVHVDMNLCQAHGECVFAAPGLFELHDDDSLTWVEEVPEERRAELEQAAQACPMMAIKLEG